MEPRRDCSQSILLNVNTIYLELISGHVSVSESIAIVSIRYIFKSEIHLLYNVRIIETIMFYTRFIC